MDVFATKAFGTKVGGGSMEGAQGVDTCPQCTLTANITLTGPCTSITISSLLASSVVGAPPSG